MSLSKFLKVAAICTSALAGAGLGLSTHSYENAFIGLVFGALYALPFRSRTSLVFLIFAPLLYLIAQFAPGSFLGFFSYVWAGPSALLLFFLALTAELLSRNVSPHIHLLLAFGALLLNFLVGDSLFCSANDFYAYLCLSAIYIFLIEMVVWIAALVYRFLKKRSTVHENQELLC